MSKQEFEEYQPTLAEFVEKFVSHNTKVYLYEKHYDYTAVTDTCKQKCTVWKLVWSGMDWQVACDSDDDYFTAHPEVERCSYRHAIKPWSVCSILPVDKKFSDAVDEVGICFWRD